MVKVEPPPGLDNLDARLREAESRHKGRKARHAGSTRSSGLSIAFRIGTELVAALIVGVGIGLLLDYWLGTRPWMLLLFFILGSAAGIVNVFRVTEGFGYAAGYKKGAVSKADETPDDEDD